MNEHFTRQAEQFIEAAKAAKIPENIQALAEQGVTRSQEAFETLSTAAKDQVKAAEELALATQAGFKSIGAKLMDNTVVNAEAAFDAARAIARAGIRTRTHGTGDHQFLIHRRALPGISRHRRLPAQ